MEYEIYKDSDELTHWGIKGQRWGIRRYQNKDGSLTPAGKKRLKAESDAIKKEAAILKNRKATQAKFDRLEAKRKSLEEQKKALSGDSKKDDDGAQTPAKKTVKDMSDNELARALTRARMEDEYNRLRPEPQQPDKNALAKQVFDDFVKPAAINAGKKLVQNAMDKAVEKITGDKVDPDSLEALKSTFDKLDYKQKIDKLRNPDKYLSEEDKNKRQQRAFEAETREAQRDGYQSVADRAKSKREEAKAAAQAAVDEKARILNAKREAQSRAGSDSVLNRFVNKTTETPPPRPATKNAIGNAIRLQDQVHLPNSFYNRTLNKYSTISSIPSATINNGRTYVDNLNWGRYDLSANRWDDD